MPGVVWYLLLAVIGTGVTVWILIHKRDSARLISYYLFAAAIADTGELLVMILFQSYVYLPGVSGNSMIENIVGHVIPNSTLWPATAILVAAYSPRYRWILLISLFYMFLDISFVWLGIYRHNWWNTYMTGIAIFVYCAVLEKLLPAIDRGNHKILRYIMFSSILVMLLLTTSVLIQVAGKTLFRVGFFGNKYRDSVIFTYILDTALAYASVFFICVLKKRCWKLMPFILCAAVDVALHQAGVLYFSGGWNIYWTMLVQAICILLFMALESKYRYALPRRS